MVMARRHQAWHGEGAPSVEPEKDGVTLWRFELSGGGSTGGSIVGPGLRSLEKLCAMLETLPQGDLLLRGDSVAFPPGGCAFFRTGTPGPASAACSTAASASTPTAARRPTAPAAPGTRPAPIRCSRRPRWTGRAASSASWCCRAILLGKSSFQFVNEEDKAKPRVQQYKIFVDAPIARPGG